VDGARIDEANAPADAEAAPAAQAAPTAWAAVAHQLTRLGSSLLLGAAAGAWAGLLVGGVVGRIAMFVIRVTSPDAVIGRQSDDGFEIGKISFESLFLFVLAAMLGTVVGIAYVIARSSLPARWRVILWTIVGAALGGSAILHADGIDFRLLEPRLLSVVMFIAIPSAGAALIALLVERRRAWWWIDRRRTIVACVPLLVPMLVFVVPLIIAAILLGVSVVATSARVRRSIHVVGPTLVRVGLAVVATWSSWNLVRDVTEIL
jgi:hypothetical protein